MKTSNAGRAAIVQREGLRTTAYQDGGGVWTIGVGHTSAAGLPVVRRGMKITAAEADSILSRDLAQFERAVDRAVTVNMNQNEFDALVSLAFNIGAGAFAGSTVVKRLNRGDRNGAANAFLMWVKDNGKVIKGLQNRRRAERLQFLSGKTVAPAPVSEAAPTTNARPGAAPGGFWARFKAFLLYLFKGGRNV